VQLEALQQGVTLSGVGTLGTPKMAQVVAFAHELGGRELHGRPGRLPKARRDLRKAGQQRNGHDEETEPQRWTDGLAEGADVDDAPTAIKRGERRRGSPLQLQFAQVVVFDHPHAFMSGPIEQTQSTFQR
jgi:hypothetical protein